MKISHDNLTDTSIVGINFTNIEASTAKGMNIKIRFAIPLDVFQIKLYIIDGLHMYESTKKFLLTRENLSTESRSI